MSPAKPKASRPTSQRNKYGNRKVETPDGKFDSRREYQRWCYLKSLALTGAIQMLRRQVWFPLVVNGVKVCSFVADFTYVRAGQLVVEDCKGFRTPVYKLKARLMKACRGIEVLET